MVSLLHPRGSPDSVLFTTPTPPPDATTSTDAPSSLLVRHLGSVRTAVIAQAHARIRQRQDAMKFRHAARQAEPPLIAFPGVVSVIFFFIDQAGEASAKGVQRHG
jgi:hypothetical protein